MDSQIAEANGDIRQDSKTNIRRYFGPLLYVSWFYLAIGIASIVVGGLALFYARESLQWPINSGSGIWCGILVTVSSSIGVFMFKSDIDKDPRSWRCNFIAHYTLVIMNITLGILHTAYSAWAIGKCHSVCTPHAMHAVMLAEAFNAGFGLTVTVGAIVLTVVQTMMMRHVNGMAGIVHRVDLHGRPVLGEKLRYPLHYYTRNL